MGSRRFQMRAMQAKDLSRREFIGVSRGDGIVADEAVGSAWRGDGIISRAAGVSSQPGSGSRWRFTRVSRADGIVSAKSVSARQPESGVRGRFTGISRGDGIISRAAGVSSQRGFSLIEIILVVVLIGGIVAFAATRILGGGDRAKVRLAQAQVQTLAEKVSQFEMDTGTLPATLDQLVTQPGGAVGWLGPYAKASELKDPWNTPYEYRVPGDGQPYDIVSYGADRRPGGDSVAADIRND